MTEESWIFEQIAYLDPYLAEITKPPSKLPIFLIGYVMGIGAGLFWKFLWSWFR